jgi:hypothetical protein
MRRLSLLALAALAAAVMGQGLATCDEAGLAPCSAAVSLCVANSGGDPTALCGACVVARGYVRRAPITQPHARWRRWPCAACRGKFDTCYKAAGT